MKFQPKSEAEIAAENLWQPGEYGFEVLEMATLGSKSFATTDRVSEKTGKDMIQLVVKVYNDEGQFRIVLDYLMEAMAFKLRHAAEACGLLAKYESGELAANDFVGKTGFLKLKITQDKTGQYADKNDIKDYIVEKSDGAEPVASKPSAGAFVDDSIPFDRIRTLA